MAIYLFYLYLLAINIIVLFYYIFTLLLNQSKVHTISLKKADGVSTLTQLKEALDIKLHVEISNPKFSETSTIRLYTDKLVVNSQYANLSYVENVVIIALNYIAGQNNWLRNDIFVKNYLTLLYYVSLLTTTLYILFPNFLIGIISIASLLCFSLLIIIDTVIRSLHANIVIEYLADIEIIDEVEIEAAKQSANIWKIRNLEVYYRILNDVSEFLGKEKTSP